MLPLAEARRAGGTEAIHLPSYPKKKVRKKESSGLAVSTDFLLQGRGSRS